MNFITRARNSISTGSLQQDLARCLCVACSKHFIKTMNAEGTQVLLSVEAEAYVEHLVKFGIKDVGGRE